MKCPENYEECEDYHPELPLESRCQRDSNAGYCTKRKEKICEWCGELYKPTNSRQKYCSKKCRWTKYNQKPEIIKRRKEYSEKPEVKKHKREYMKKYRERPEVKEKIKEYNQRPEVKKYKKEYREKNKDRILKQQKEYREKPEVKKYKKEWEKKYYLKKGLEQINGSIYVYDENGNKIGFKRDWFYAKYPQFTWDFYKEQGWTEKSLEMLNEANRICKGCGAHAMEVHHWKNFYKYPEIALKNSNLIVLCVFCHKEIHNKNKRYSLKIKELNKIT